jgi:serine/threonine protein kinase
VNFAFNGSCLLISLNVCRSFLFIYYSDVWAFGVTCAEILRRSEPYPGMDATEVAVGVLKEGWTPPFPDSTPLEMFDIIKQCFTFEPQNRITMEMLNKQFTAAFIY